MHKQALVAWRRVLGPTALAGRASGWLVAVACMAVLVAIVIAEHVTPRTLNFGALSFIPVLVAVWLLGTPLAAAVTATAMLFRVMAIGLDGLHPATALVEVGTIGVVAGLGRFAVVTLTAYWAAQSLADERDRIARELHDGIIQSLFGVGMGLRGAGARSEEAALKARMDESVAELDGVIHDLRNYIYGLRPMILAEQQLDEALEELARDFQATTKVRTVAEIDHLVAAGLSGKAADVVQMAREALSNVSRHASADNCRLTLRRDGRLAVLEVRDDGRGFEPNEIDGHGRGLSNLRERAAAVGGHAAIVAAPNRGTAVRITIPVR